MTEERPATNGNGRARVALTGAGRRVDLTNAREVDRLRKRKAEAWQDEAWSYYDLIGEIKFAYWYFGSCMSRIRLYAAAQPDPAQSPMPVDDPDAKVDAGLAADATAILDRLRNSETGVSGLLYEAGINIGVPGEGYLVGVEARAEQRDPLTNALTAPARPESWDIKSIDELEVKSDGKAYLKGDDGQAKGEPLDPESTFVCRLWQRHPRHSDSADSLMRGVLEACDEYLILSRAVRAAATNRIAMRGLTLISDALHFGPVDPTTDSGDGEGHAQKFLDDLMTAAETAIQNEGSASAAVDVFISFPGNLDPDKLTKRLTFDSPLDPQMPGLRKECIDRIARGLPLPPERILGHQSTTFANAAQITEDEFAKFLEPFVTTLVQSFTAGFLWPQLVEAGRTPEEARTVLVWYDPSELVSKPDQGADADAAAEKGAVGEEAVRRAHGFGDGDAPTIEDRLWKLVANRGQLDPGTTATLLGQLGVIDATAVDAAQAAPPVSAEAVAAAARPRPANDLGHRLAEIDRDLRTRLLVAADVAMRRAMEVAGARLRRKGAGDNALQATTGPGVVAPTHVVAHVGRSMVAALGTSDDELLADAFAALAAPFESWTAWAQASALRALTDAGAALDDAAVADLTARQAEDRAAGWGLLAAGLERLAFARLYDPSPAAPPLGEHDPDLSVPAGLVRGAMARAGGNGAVHDDGTSADGTPLMGVATGPGVLDAAGQAGFAVEAYQWEYGVAPRRSSFDPHRNLDGLVFSDFTDPALANPMGWPAAFCLPGDHGGCLCDCVPVLIQSEALAASAEEVA